MLICLHFYFTFCCALPKENAVPTKIRALVFIYNVRACIITLQECALETVNLKICGFCSCQ